jgi:predicted nucleic acid-binding protein
MPLDDTTPLFFDASCLVAASGSPNGGSGFLLLVCRQGQLTVVVSQPVLLEAERNVAENMGVERLLAFEHLLATTPFRVSPPPDAGQIVVCVELVGQKDAHVLAATLEAQAPYLITLDQPLARRVNAANCGVTALSPGTFINTILPTHPDYATIR